MEEFTFKTYLGDVEIEVEAEIRDYDAEIISVTINDREFPLAHLTGATISALETEAQANHVGDTSESSEAFRLDMAQRARDAAAA